MATSRALSVVVTAGPTREHIDPVRYMTNESSGRMGFAIARAAARAGHRVTLIAGPVHLETPKGVQRVDVVSARDLLAATREAFDAAHALFMAAAVADWRPARRRAGKWRAKDSGASRTRLELVKNPDVLATVAKRKGERTVIGFALETDEGLRRARAKMERKNMDFVVLNDASALNARRTVVRVIPRSGEPRPMEGTKDAVAKELVRLLERAPALD